MLAASGLGATLTIGNDLATDIMVRFLEQHPRALSSGSLSLKIANTAEIVRQVCNFDLDLGLIEGELQHPELDISPWHHDEMVVFCGPDHPLANSQNLTDADLLRWPWILREPGSGTRQTFERSMHGLLPELTIALELQQPEAICRAVAAGLGIGCLSRRSLQPAFEAGDLVPLPVRHRDMQRCFYVILHKQKHHSRYIRTWLDLCHHWLDDRA